MISFLTTRAKRPRRLAGKGARAGRSLRGVNFSQWGGKHLVGKSGCSLKADTENVSLLATGKTSSGQTISALVTGMLRWLELLVCKKGWDCLLIKFPFVAAAMATPCIIDGPTSAHCDVIY